MRVLKIEWSVRGRIDPHVAECLVWLCLGVSTEKLDELEDKVSKLEAERDELEVKAEVLTRERDSAQERNTEIEEKIKELESEVEELRSENEGQNNEIEELKNELENAGDRLGPLSPTLSLEGQDIEVKEMRIIRLLRNESYIGKDI